MKNNMIRLWLFVLASLLIYNEGYCQVSKPMQDYNSIKDPHLQVWFNDWVNVRTSGGESFTDQLLRVGEFLQELKDSGKKTVLLFCHGGVLACRLGLGKKSLYLQP